jgi:hypothetical protein
LFPLSHDILPSLSADRDGNIVQTSGRGAANIMPGWGPKGKGLNKSAAKYASKDKPKLI